MASHSLVVTQEKQASHLNIETQQTHASQSICELQDPKASQITGENHDSQANPCPDRETQTKKRKHKNGNEVNKNNRRLAIDSGISSVLRKLQRTDSQLYDGKDTDPKNCSSWTPASDAMLQRKIRPPARS